MACSCAEKQKVKFIYGVLEHQFRGYYARAERKQGNTGEVLLQELERRLDNVVFRMGYANYPPRSPSAGDTWSLHCKRPSCEHSLLPG